MSDARTKLQNAYKDAVQKIEKVFEPLLTAVNIKIGLLESQNLDASNYFDLNEGAFFNYYERRDLFTEKRDEALSRLSSKFDEQFQKLDDAQDQEAEDDGINFLEIAYFIAKEVLENGVKIKVGDIEWDSSKPLGGEGSMFDDLRNTVFEGIGLDPDSWLAGVIRDPINSVADLGENLDQEAGKALNDLKATADNALDDAKATIDKAMDDAKREVDKAMTDIKREIDKALADARKAADKAIANVSNEIGRVAKRGIKIELPKL